MAVGGARKGAGRKKGIPNKINSDVKGMILAALDKVGGPEYLEKQANANPNAFLTLLGKVLPTTIEPTKDGKLTITWEK